MMRIQILLTAFILAAAIPVLAQEEANIHGYSTTEAAIQAPGQDETEYIAGASQFFRVKGDWKPEDSLSFHAEVLWQTHYGSRNPAAMMIAEGLVLDVQAAFPFDEFHSSMTVDQAWGMLIIGPVDLQAGRLPVGWGTGYLWNPTNRTAPYVPGIQDEEATESVFGIVPTIHLPADLALTGYIAFQDRTQRAITSFDEGALKNLPFGLKLQYRSGIVDCSVSFIRENINVSGWREHFFVGADFSLILGPFETYAEGVYRLPMGVTDSGRTPDINEDLEIVCGANVKIPVLEVTFRMEYAHFGAGASATSEYDWPGLVQGACPALAEDYLFLMLEREWESDWNTRAGGLVNLNDASFAIAAEVVWQVFLSAELGIFGMYYWGGLNTEMNGVFPTGPGTSADIIRPEAGIRLKLHF